jgi:nucleotide-binding universal stress UspA family protein
MSTPTGAVVVAIGTQGRGAAVRYAVAEARRTRSPLHLVHVLQLQAGEAYAGVHGGLLEQARQVLDAAVATAGELSGGTLRTSAEVLSEGWVVAALAGRCENASLLVLQHRAHSRLRRVFTGSVAQSVAGRVRCPVVSVPEQRVQPTPPQGFVVAAVQDPVEAPPILRAGFEAALGRGARLVVLHAWYRASA